MVIPSKQTVTGSNPVAITDERKPISQRLVGFFYFEKPLRIHLHKELTNKKTNLYRNLSFSFSKWNAIRINFR